MKIDNYINNKHSKKMKKFRFLALAAMVGALAFGFASCSDKDEPNNPQPENPQQGISLKGKVYEVLHNVNNSNSGAQEESIYRLTFADRKAVFHFESINVDSGMGGATNYKFKYRVDPKTYQITFSLLPVAEYASRAELQEAKDFIAKIEDIGIDKELETIIYTGFNPNEGPNVSSTITLFLRKPINLENKSYFFIETVSGFVNRYVFSFKKTEASLYFEQYEDDSDEPMGGNERCYFKYTVDPLTHSIKLSKLDKLKEFEDKYPSDKAAEVISNLKTFTVLQNLQELNYSGYTPYQGNKSITLKLETEE